MITRIRRDDFDLYSDIVILAFDYNCISAPAKALIVDSSYRNLPTCQTMFYIEEGSFSHLNKLWVLDLIFDRMSEAPTHLPPSIKFLRLDFTFIGGLTTGYVKHLPNLLFISVAYNCGLILVCPRNFTIPAKWPHSLQYLNISGNALKKIPTKAFPNSLKALSIDFSGITTIYDKDFETVPKLETLSLAGTCLVFNGSTVKACSLVIQEKVFMPLQYIKNIDLSYNQLEHLPQKIFIDNLRLESLSLRGNHLYQLPGEGSFFHLCKL